MNIRIKEHNCSKLPNTKLLGGFWPMGEEHILDLLLIMKAKNFGKHIPADLL